MIRVIYAEASEAGLRQCRGQWRVTTISAGQVVFFKEYGCIDAGDSPAPQNRAAGHGTELLRARNCMQHKEHLHCRSCSCRTGSVTAVLCFTSVLHTSFPDSYYLGISAEKHYFCYRWLSLLSVQMTGL